jgi:predicted CopG family antitoxin
MLMATSLVKTITIRDEVYKKLLTVKKKDESFSELFERLAENRDQTEILKKLRASVEFKNKGEMLSEIYSSRAERR